MTNHFPRSNISFQISTSAKERTKHNFMKINCQEFYQTTLSIQTNAKVETKLYREVFTVHCQGCDVMYEQCAKYNILIQSNGSFHSKRILLTLRLLFNNIKLQIKIFINKSVSIRSFYLSSQLRCERISLKMNLIPIQSINSNAGKIGKLREKVQKM